MLKCIAVCAVLHQSAGLLALQGGGRLGRLSLSESTITYGLGGSNDLGRKAIRGSARSASFHYATVPRVGSRDILVVTSFCRWRDLQFRFHEYMILLPPLPPSFAQHSQSAIGHDATLGAGHGPGCARFDPCARTGTDHTRSDQEVKGAGGSSMGGQRCRPALRRDACASRQLLQSYNISH